MFLLSLYQQKAMLKLLKLLTKGFKTSVYWNEYKVFPEQRYNANDNIRKLIHPSWQEISRLFVLVYLNNPNSTVNSHRKYFLPGVKKKITTLKLMEEICMIN